MIDDERTKRNIASNVARLLEDRGWTQTQLAETTGEKQPRISQIIHGIHMPGAGLLARIAEAFDVSIDRLVADPPEPVCSEVKKTG